MPYSSSVWSSLSSAQIDLYKQAFSQQLQKAVASFRPDVIHCHHFWLLAALTRELFPRHRVVASCHGTGLRQGQNLPQLLETARPQLERLDHGYALTQQQAQLMPLPACRISVVGAGFDAEIFHPRNPLLHSTPKLLFVGKLSRSKGCWELLDALEPMMGEELEVLFAGDGHGDEADEIKHRASSMGVQLLGRLPQTDLARVMRESQILVLPSYFEGLPLVLAEALSSGCQIVVNALPGVLDWFPEPILASGWIRLLELPELEGPDRPAPHSIPDYVSSLRVALTEQLRCHPRASQELDVFLGRQSWAGVYQRIALHYEVNS